MALLCLVLWLVFNPCTTFTTNRMQAKSPAFPALYRVYLYSLRVHTFLLIGRSHNFGLGLIARDVKPLKRLIVSLFSQLFDDNNHLNQDASNYIFSTEGHVFRIDSRFRKRPWDEESKMFAQRTTKRTFHTQSSGGYNDSIGVGALE